MEYEVYYGCNIAGALVVGLVFLYTMLLGKPMVSISGSDEEADPVRHSHKKSQ